MRVRKLAHRADPTVCAPERATRSRESRPLDANADTRDAALEEGDGRLLFAAAWLAVRASRRPRGTAHVGPLSCIYFCVIVARYSTSVEKIIKY
jgi:hypothetical protein